MEESFVDSEAKLSVLMIDDQAIYGEVLKKILQDVPDCKFEFCQNPLEAIDLALKIKPTVILQDLTMPEMDGLDLVRKFRENKDTKDIPMIVLSSTEDPTVKYKAFSNGANDYMVKLPDQLEIVARIKYHSTAYINFCEKKKALSLLKESQDVLKKELVQARNYVESLLPKKIDNEHLKTDWVYKSSTILGGDCFGYHYIDEENFAIYLLDVCGHGVGAALLSVSAMNVLRSQSLFSVDFREPSQVLGGLSLAFDMERQNDMFFTIWYGVYNIRNRTLKYGTGGHPPAILENGDFLEYLGTRDLVIGADTRYKYSQNEIILAENSALYVFSDGVYEIFKKSNNEMLTIFELANILQSEEDCDSVMGKIQQIQAKDKFDDDFSLCKITVK